MKKLIILAALISLTACNTRPDGTAYACAAEAMGIGPCAGSTAEGIHAYNVSRIRQDITALEVGAY